MNKTKTQTPVQTGRKSSNYRTNRSETLGRSHANNRTAKSKYLYLIFDSRS
jgi:hypothetical protein